MFGDVQAVHISLTDVHYKQPIRAPDLGHMIGYQPIRDQHFLVRSVPTTIHLSLPVGGSNIPELPLVEGEPLS